MRLLDLLLRFLILGVGPGDDDAGEDSAASGADPGTTIDDEGSTGDDAFDDLLELTEAGGGKARVPSAEGGTEENPAIVEARRRADDAVRDRDEAVRQRQEMERRLPPPPAPVDQVYDSEERELADLQRQVHAGNASQEAYNWRKWQIDSNRNIRASTRASQNALYQANDIADRSAFEKLEITKPNVYKAYATRVEQAVNEIRRSGQQVPPRLAVLRLLIGDDIMNGKVKPKKAAKAAEPATRVDRGRSPTVRSDVRAGGKGGQSKRDQLAQRLDGVKI